MPSQRVVAISLACLGMVAHAPCVVLIKGRGSVPSKCSFNCRVTQINYADYRMITAKKIIIIQKEERKKEKKMERKEKEREKETKKIN